MGTLRRVKRWYYIVLGAILVGGVASIYIHRQDLGMTRNPETTAAMQPAHINWVTVDRSREGFKLEMPAGTEEIQIPAFTGTGTTDRVDMIFSYPDSDTSYSIAWADNPPVEQAAQNNPDIILDHARDGALARTETVLVSESKSTWRGYPARDFIGKNEGGGIFSARLILAGGRLYMLMASFPALSARSDSDVKRFFDSFRVTSQPRAD